MAWLILVVAGLLEVVWALGLKFTDGFTRLVPSVVTAAAIVASMYLLSRAAQELPIGTAYAVWVAIGIIGSAIGGAILFDEPMPALRVMFIALLLVSVAGLKITSGA